MIGEIRRNKLAVTFIENENSLLGPETVMSVRHAYIDILPTKEAKRL